MNLPPDDFDERARAAGYALRQAAPPDGLRRIQAARRNRRIAQVGGVAAVAVLGIGGIVALASGGDDTIVTTDPTTVTATVAPTVPTTTPAPTEPTTAPSSPATPVDTTPPSTQPATTPTTQPPTTQPEAPADPFALATAVAATPNGILLGLPDGSWVPTPFTEPAEGPAYVAGTYVVHQRDSANRWTITDAPIHIVTAGGVTEWEPPGPLVDADGQLRYRVLDAAIVEGEPMMLVSQSDGGMPDTADERLLLVALDDGEVRDLGSFGGWESSIPQARLAGDRIYALRSATVLYDLLAIEFDGTVSSAQELTEDTWWQLSLGDDGTAYAFHTASDGASWQLESVALLADGSTLPMTFPLPGDFEEVAGGCEFPHFTSVQLWCFGPGGPSAVHISDSSTWAPTDGLPDAAVVRWRVGTPPVDPTAGGSTAPTVWLAGKLLGYFEGGQFVAVHSVEDAPPGLVGSAVVLVEESGDEFATAAVTDETCSSVYLDPPPQWGIWGTEGAMLAPPPGVHIGVEPSSEMRAALADDLAAFGLDADNAAVVSGPFAADGSVDALVTYMVAPDPPTWIATWDEDTRAFTTIEGDVDPVNALPMSSPFTSYLDLDLDGNYEVAYSVGDAWVVRELATGDDIAAVAAHPC